MSKIKNGGLDQYGAGPFEQQQFGTAGDARVREHALKVFSTGLRAPDSAREFTTLLQTPPPHPIDAFSVSALTP